MMTVCAIIFGSLMVNGKNNDTISCIVNKLYFQTHENLHRVLFISVKITMVRYYIIGYATGTYVHACLSHHNYGSPRQDDESPYNGYIFP